MVRRPRLLGVPKRQKKISGGTSYPGGSEASEKNFLVLDQGIMGGGSCLAHPQGVPTPGEGRDGGLQPPSDFQSVCEKLDPLQKIPWRFAQNIGIKMVTRHTSHKARRVGELHRKLHFLRRLAHTLKISWTSPHTNYRTPKALKMKVMRREVRTLKKLIARG